MKRHTHQELDTEVFSIAGHYKVLEEGKMTFGKREFLYVMGGAVVDCSCCGSGGCQFVQVPGYILSWKMLTDANGLSISEVEPITDSGERKEISKMLARKFPHAQISILSDISTKA
jgi:hypothetical protein